MNLNGELVGINTAIFGPNGGNVGIGFAIPSNMMKSLVDQIAEFGEVRRGLLGILGNDVDAGLAEAMNVPVNKGAFIREVQPETAAEKAGLRAGDIITAVNGRKLSGFRELAARISSMGAGAEVDLTILRDGDKKTIKVTLDDASKTQVTAAQLHPALEGAELANGEDEAGNKGVEVTELDRGSPAARIGLQPEDVIVSVNRQRIESIAELREAMDASQGVIALNIKRGASTRYLVIRQ